MLPLGSINRTNSGLVEIAYVDITLTFAVDTEYVDCFYSSVDVNQYIPSGYRMISLLSRGSIAASMWYWLRANTGEITFCSTVKLDKMSRDLRLYLVKNVKHN